MTALTERLDGYVDRLTMQGVELPEKLSVVTVSGKTRAQTEPFYVNTGDVILLDPTDFYYAVYSCESDGTYIQALTSNWQALESYTVLSGGYVYVYVKKTDETNFTDEDIAELENSIVVRTQQSPASIGDVESISDEKVGEAVDSLFGLYGSSDYLDLILRQTYSSKELSTKSSEIGTVTGGSYGARSYSYQYLTEGDVLYAVLKTDDTEGKYAGYIMLRAYPASVGQKGDTQFLGDGDTDIDAAGRIVEIPDGASYAAVTLDNACLGRCHIRVFGDLVEPVTEKVTESSVETETPYFIGYSSGNMIEHTSYNYRATDYLPCGGYNNLVLNHICYRYKDLSGMAFYDEDKNFISGKQFLAYVDSYHLEIPEDAAYFRTTLYNTTKNFSYVLEKTLQADLDQLEKDLQEDMEQLESKIEEVNSSVDTVKNTLELLDGMIDTVTSDDMGLTAGQYISYSGGGVVSISNMSFHTTDYLDVLGYDAILLSNYSNGTVDARGLAFYDSEYTCLQGYRYTEENEDISLEVPDGAAYLRATIYSSNPSAVLTKIFRVSADKMKNLILTIHQEQMDAMEKEEEDAESRQYLMFLIKNVLCIGDSLTRGAYYDSVYSGSAISENYPYFLGKLTGWTVTNAGSSGYSASTWYTKKMDSYDYTAYDTVIIWLGTNNGLTDTLDDDTDADSYEDYAETETGYYCKIIETILEQNSDIRIFLGTVYASKGDVATTNEVIQQIAEKYPDNVMGVVDNNDGELYKGSNQSILHPFNNSVHFGKVGNLVLAKHWLDGITEIMNGDLGQYELLLE